MRRRETLIAAGGIVTVGTGLAALTGDASGQRLSVESIDVADATHETKTGEVYSPWLDLEVSAEWAVNTTPTDVRVMLLVGPRDDRELLQMDTYPVATQESSGTYQVHGKVIESDHYASDDFDVSEPGGATTVEIPFAVRVEIRAESETLVETTATETATLTVEHTGAEAQVSVSLSGGVVVQESEDDPRPV